MNFRDLVTLHIAVILLTHSCSAYWDDEGDDEEVNDRRLAKNYQFMARYAETTTPASAEERTTRWKFIAAALKSGAVGEVRRAPASSANKLRPPSIKKNPSQIPPALMRHLNAVRS